MCFQRPLKNSSVFSNTLKKKLKGFCALLSCKCSASHTCRVASSPLSLSPNIFVLFSTARACTQTLAFAAFSFEGNVKTCSKISQTGSHQGRHDPKRCNQIKIMPFIQTSFRASESARPKATALYVYDMSLFLVACLLNRGKPASSARCL